MPSKYTSVDDKEYLPYNASTENIIIYLKLPDDNKSQKNVVKNVGLMQKNLATVQQRKEIINGEKLLLIHLNIVMI